MAKTKETDLSESNDLDLILEDAGGAFGKYQIFNYILLLLVMCFSGMSILDYVFTTLDLDYRCRIPECDVSDKTQYETEWLPHAVPYKGSHPSNCYRYQTVNSTNGENLIHDYYSYQVQDDQCDASLFNRSTLVKCNNDDLVYRTDERSIVNEFHLTCDENKWKLVFVGVANNIGRLIFLPITGHFSDKYGRKKTLITCMLTGSVFKLIRSFSINYLMFVIFEVLDAAVSSAFYPTAIILGMEWATTRRRVAVICLIISLYPMGQVVTGLVASYTHDFRLLLRIISLPGFLFISYIWICPESIRWLLVQKKYDEAMSILHKAARINNKKLSQKTLDIVANLCDNRPKAVNSTLPEDASKQELIESPLRVVFKSSVLRNRTFICAFCWVAATFVTYGVSIASISLKGDKYTNFIVVSLGAMPGILLTFIMLSLVSRRWNICVSLFITGFSIIGSKIISDTSPTISLILFFAGKCFIHHSFTSLYVYTSELWPTNVRHSLMGLCSMVGRIGSITAPLTPLLMYYMELLPFILFSSVAFISGILILYLPETFNKHLPDTIEDVKNIDRKK